MPNNIFIQPSTQHQYCKDSSSLYNEKLKREIVHKKIEMKRYKQIVEDEVMQGNFAELKPAHAYGKFYLEALVLSTGTTHRVYIHNGDVAVSRSCNTVMDDGEYISGQYTFTTTAKYMHNGDIDSEWVVITKVDIF